MSRAKWKGPYVKTRLLVNLLSVPNEKIMKTCRNSIILPKFVGITFKIYNGKIFSNLTISDQMIGHKFGEFVPTKKKNSFKKK